MTREIDRREPGRFWRGAPDLRRRRAFQSHVSDAIGSYVATASVQLTCPACGHPVYAPGDSADEHIDCAGCNAVLSTRQSPSGVAVEVAVGETRIANALAARKHEPPTGWDERMIEKTLKDRR